MNIIIVSGISGIKKSEFIDNFRKMAGIEDISQVIKFEDELTNQSRRKTGVVPPANITTFLEQESSSNKRDSIEKTFSWITNDIKIKKNVEYVFLNVHITYYKKTEYFPPLNPANFIGWIDNIDPNANVKIINLIDDIFNIWKELEDKEKIYPNTKLTLREILGWRSIETLQSESLAYSIAAPGAGKKNAIPYMVSVRHPLSTFKNLIMKEIPVSVYLSYPISKTRNSKNKIKEVNVFRKKIHNLGSKYGIAIFDPVTIDELILKNALKQKSSPVVLDKSKRWPIDLDNMLVKDNKSTIKLTKAEIKSSFDYINHQVKSRDLKLVEEAALLVVYRPFFSGPSIGAKAEINHAKEKGIDMSIYSPKSDKIPRIDNPFDSSITPINNMNKFYQIIEQKLIKLRKENIKSTKKRD